MGKKSHFYIIKLKRNFLPALFVLFVLCLLVFSNSNLLAVKSGLQLWANSMIPSLFPFFVATELLMHTNIIEKLGYLLNSYMKPLFNVRGEGSFALIMGLISGYPIGAKIASTFRKENICTKEECERLLSFTNNSGPLFILGAVGLSMFKSSTVGLLLYISHFFSSITVGLLFRYWKYNIKTLDSLVNMKNNISKKSVANFSNLGEVIAESLKSSISTILIIGGFVVLFSSIISILKSSGFLNLLCICISPCFKMFNVDVSFIQPFITGLFEITNGINSISNIACRKISVNIIFTSFLLGFGGISVFLQVLSIISKTDLSIKPYIIGKILQGFISCFYTFLLISIFPFFNLNL